MNLFLPIILAVVPLVGGILVYWFQKSQDRKNQILQERRNLYRRFVSLVEMLEIDGRLGAGDAAVATVKETVASIKDYKSNLAQLMVTAPDNVVTPLADFDRKMISYLKVLYEGRLDSNEDDGKKKAKTKQEEEFRKKFEEVVLQMRIDSFEKTLITKEAIESILTRTLQSLVPFR